jgi:hypothetical protein
MTTSKQSTVTLYVAHEDTDKSEGRGGTLVIGYYESREDAARAAEGKGVWGGVGRIETLECVRLGDDYYPVDRYIHASTVVTRDATAARARALAKLSPEERAALGFPGPRPGDAASAGDAT